MRVTFKQSCVGFFAFILSTSVVRAATIYNVLDLSTLGGTSSRSDGFGTVNASGQVVGFSSIAGNVTIHGIRTPPEAAPMTPASDMGNLGGTDNHAIESDANSINASGQVVGHSFTSTGESRGYRTAANAPIAPSDQLGTLGGNESTATGINNAGQAVGTSAVAGPGTSHAFRTAANAAINPITDDLGTLGGTQSTAFGINASGQTVGSAYLTGDTAFHAFRTTANGKISDFGTDLGTLGGTNSEAYGVNDFGQAVGYSQTTGNLTTHAFRTTGTGNVGDLGTDLGTLGGTSSIARAVNASGQVVGWSLLSDNVTEHAFFVDATGAMQDLNALIPGGSGWVLQEAHGINATGQIAGFGIIDGQEHAFLLTPVPEPGSLSLIALGGLVLLRMRRC